MPNSLTTIEPIEKQATEVTERILQLILGYGGIKAVDAVAEAKQLIRDLTDICVSLVPICDGPLVGFNVPDRSEFWWIGAYDEFPLPVKEKYVCK